MIAMNDLSPAQFGRIAEIAFETAGLSLPPTKRRMVQARISTRLRALGLENFEAYDRLLASSCGEDERQILVSALTTNVTSFFRERHHFDDFAEITIPALRERIDQDEPIRIWSAGCSRGDEPYSIAMVCCANLNASEVATLKILATDIDHEVLHCARRATYSEAEIAAIPQEFRATYLTPLNDGSSFCVAETVRRLVHFRTLNLMHDWPMHHKLDVIFCRNVLIYFDRRVQDRLCKRFENILRPGGFLFLGHSERIPPHLRSKLNACGTTSYQKRSLNLGPVASGSRR